MTKEAPFIVREYPHLQCAFCGCMLAIESEDVSGFILRHMVETPPCPHAGKAFRYSHDITITDDQLVPGDGSSNP